ncbi:MAG: hypothetical protein QM774_09935 [Gordonia sp. (in: high G+C Gram-positive bacteria)]|uniref:septum site-determining protein Ssd n=1 Tax=Gordonia sp. (in: high G+C Gram-positive bacteria) TaxID=84139 RepID=UPI0039E3759D
MVVDGPALDRLARRGPPNRPGVIIVSGRDGDPDVWRAGLVVGAQGGYVVPDDEDAFVAALSALRRPRRNAAGVLAVVGGHGGAGVSTLAASLALAGSRRGSPVLLLDVEPAGAGLDLLLGAEDAPGLRWADITGQTGSLSGPALSAALPTAGDRLRVLTRARDDGAPLAPETVLAVLDAARLNGDTVVADVGRAGDPAAGGVLDSADLIAVVTTATVPGVAATRKLVARLGRREEAGIVVRGPAPGGLRAAQIATAVGLPLLATLRHAPGLPGQCEDGGLRARPRSPQASAAGVLLDALTARGGRR